MTKGLGVRVDMGNPIKKSANLRQIKVAADSQIDCLNADLGG